MDRSGQRLGSGSVGLRASGLEVAQPRASFAHGRGGIDRGHRESLARAGPRQDATARVDDLGLTEEAQPAEGAGLVGGYPDDLVLDRARSIDQAELAGLDIAGDEPRRPLAADRPRGRRDDGLGAVDRECAGGLGKELVVAHQHADAAERRVEGREALARAVAVLLGRRNVDLAWMPSTPSPLTQTPVE